jgi:hypothetical protein
LRFNISELGIGFFHCLRDVLILLNSHSNGLILESKRILICLLSLGEEIVHLSPMLVVLCTDSFYLLDQPVSDIFIKVFDVEVLVLLIKVKKQLLFVLDILVNSQESWNFLRQNVDQVLFAQVFEQNLGSFSAIFC